jgi:hypothetical protein
MAAAMSSFRAGFLSLLMPALVNAATAPVPAAAATPAKKESSSGWVFSLLPKSLQKNPRLELTVITELTEAGKKLPPVSSQAPVYFELFSSGPRHLGHAQGNEVTLKQEEIERLLTRALAANGYLPAAPPTKPAALLILYTWGAHNLLTEGDEENPTLSGEQVARNLLDRAALVGGEKFAKRLLDLFQQADTMSVAASARPPPGGEQVFTPALMEFTNPVSMFKRADPKNEFLVDQAASDVYYVVASAYDHQSVSAKRRVLLWRTRMTVAAQGISQQQSLPTLVLSAAPYFGKDMPEPEILSKRAVREGTVEVGTPTVVEPATSSAKK